MAAENQNPTIVQTPSVPTPQPPTEPTKPSQDQAKTSTHQEAKLYEPKASEPKTSKSTSHTSERTEIHPAKTTPISTPETTKPTDQPTENLTQTEAVGEKGRGEELVQEEATLKEGEVSMAEEEEEEVKGERMVEGEIVVEADELRADREREMKTNEREGARDIEGVAEEASENEEGSGGESEKEGGNVEGSNGESAEVNEDVSEGIEVIESEEGTEILSEDNQDRREEEGEVVNKEEKKMEELSKGTRRSRRIAGRAALEGTGQEGGRKRARPWRFPAMKKRRKRFLSRENPGAPQLTRLPLQRRKSSYHHLAHLLSQLLQQQQGACPPLMRQ